MTHRPLCERPLGITSFFPYDWNKTGKRSVSRVAIGTEYSAAWGPIDRVGMDLNSLSVRSVADLRMLVMTVGTPQRDA